MWSQAKCLTCQEANGVPTYFYFLTEQGLVRCCYCGSVRLEVKPGFNVQRKPKQQDG